ncbi:hypothetical protein FK268_09965 [Tsukamurella sputi]|uniref:Uncharacterized protein n=1 Tax=Tsukamurella sputi TaxID=2591848 RepID=A0A5C5RPE7_9ACTN|nr:hypothetical protein [Tsukamurella sputi]TWS23965.1 hypothetical protein FK268_09965 [Tsukamurella sputi]
MAPLTRAEQYILAPSDPAWGDERNRDEYYRASSVGFFWATYAFLAVAVLAALQGAIAAAIVAALAPGLIQMGSVQRYCARHGVAYYSIAAAFNTGRRRIVGLVTLVPLYLALAVILAAKLGVLEGDAATLAGGVVGAICGAGAAWAAYLIGKRQHEDPSEPDDVFE